MEKNKIKRRRFVRIIAGAAALSTVPALPSPAASKLAAYNWRGIALGAQASISLYHEDPDIAAQLSRRCVGEIRRLEGQFSLYRGDSAISRLNANGYLESPPLDLLRLLSTAGAISTATGRMFDITVQPLWDLYATHFAAAHTDSTGPRQRAIEDALALVDQRQIEIDSNRIAFAHSDMKLTLNGIAQGYVTDRVSDLLRAEGLANVLVNVGEIRGLGSHPDARPWTVAIKDPLAPRGLGQTVELGNRALSTSAGHGTRFDASGQHHHLFNPHTGRSNSRYRSITVIASNATIADALSTGFASMDSAQISEVLEQYPGVVVQLTTTGAKPIRLPR